MFIQLTQEELNKISDIGKLYEKEADALTKKIDASRKAEAKAEQEGRVYPEKEKEKRRQLSLKFQALMDTKQEQIQALREEFERQRFAQIQGGATGIIANAKEQIPALIEDTYRHMYEALECFFDKDFELENVGAYKNGIFLLNANFAAASLRKELKLHIEALKNDKEALRDLLETIVEAIENSDLTDSKEVVLESNSKADLDLMRFRRNPLADLKTYAFMNDKANARMLQDSDIFQQKADGQIIISWNINQAPQSKEQVPCLIALTYTGNKLVTSRKMTGYDKAVYEAIGTRFYYWQQEKPQKPLYITPQEIWRTMNGKSSRDGKAKPSETQIKKICDSIDKMRFTRLYMDITQEIEAGYITPDEKITSGTIDTYLLEATKAEFTTDKGNVVQGYRLAEDPALFYYNGLKNHLLYVPYEMLDTSSYTSDSENVIEFKSYLLQQIQLMKNAAEGSKRFKRSNVILLETIYRDTGILPPEERIEGDYANEATRQQIIRRNRKADRQKIEGLLDAWKAKGWINGYTVLNAKNEPIKEKQQAKGYSVSI